MFILELVEMILCPNFRGDIQFYQHEKFITIYFYQECTAYLASQQYVPSPYFGFQKKPTVYALKHMIMGAAQ